MRARKKYLIYEDKGKTNEFKRKEKKINLKKLQGTPKPKTSSQDYKINKGYKKFQSRAIILKVSYQKNIKLNITTPLNQDDNQKSKKWAKKKIQEELFRGKKTVIEKNFREQKKINYWTCFIRQ